MLYFCPFIDFNFTAQYISIPMAMCNFIGSKLVRDSEQYRAILHLNYLVNSD